MAYIGLAIVFFVLTGGSRVILPLGLGILGALSLTSVFDQLPLWIQKLFARFHVIVDLLSGYIIYKMFGTNTATALFGAALVSLLTSVYLIQKKRKLIDEPRELKRLVRARTR